MHLFRVPLPWAAASSLFVTALIFMATAPDPTTVSAALMGLAATLLCAMGSVDAALARADFSSSPRGPAEERRLRGGFRRQHRPDSPGRPMPRAPGAMS